MALRGAGGSVNLASPGTIGGTTPALVNASSVYVYNGSELTNYERLELVWSSNVATLQSAKGGTGTLRDLAVIPNSTVTIQSVTGQSVNINVDAGASGATNGAALIRFKTNGGIRGYIGWSTGDGGKFGVYNDSGVAYVTFPNAGGASGVAVCSSNGQSLGILRLTELTTIAAAANTDTTIQMPAGAIILAVSVRVTTAITCTSTFTVGDSGSATRFGSGLSKAVNTTNAGTVAPYLNASALSVRITPDTVPSDNTGRVRTTIYYILSTPPTS